MNSDLNTFSESLRLDGNAVAGELQMLLGVDVTILRMICSHCHKEGVFANLLAYVRGPGVVLRCPTCDGLVARIVKTASETILIVDGIADGLKSANFPKADDYEQNEK